MVHDNATGAVLVGVSRHLIAFVSDALRTRVRPSDASTAKRPQGCRRVLVALLGLALTHSPAVALAQVAAGRLVEGVFDPRGVPSGLVSRHDSTVLTLERLIDLDRLDEARAKLGEQFAEH